MKIKVFEPPLADFDIIETEPLQMNRGGDLDSYKRNNSIVEPARMFTGGRFGGAPPQRIQNTDNEPDPRFVEQFTPEEIAVLNRRFGPSASERQGFNPAATMNISDARADAMGLFDEDINFDDLPDAVRDRILRDREQARRRAEEARQQREADAAAEADARAAADAEFQRRLAAGELTPEEIQGLIDGGLNEQQVLQLISTYQLNENQLAQLFDQGLLTREQIEALVAGQLDEVAETAEEAVEQAAAAGLTEEQVNELIQQGLAEYSPDMSQYVTQSGLESLFQNFLTPDQLEAYLPQDQTDTISALEKKIADLEKQYSDVTSQYEADAVNQQIADAKQEVSDYFAASAPTGPRTGSTSQFDAGASFLPGGSPIASLIEGQREGLGQDAFTTYLKTFTPSYSAFEEPFSPEEYNPTGGTAPMPPMEEPEADRLEALLSGMEEEPMMPEEESFSTQDVATGIATSALQISGSPEQALMAVEQAADELRAMLS
jgi:hypothetical protein